MTIEELKELINKGEKVDVEFKKSENDLNKGIYQSYKIIFGRNAGLRGG